MIDEFPTKKAAKRFVEDNPNYGKPTAKPRTERQPTPVDSLESIMVSLRLEIGRLADMIAILTTKIDNLGG